MALELNTKKFKLVGGELSLDFVNTVSGWERPPVKPLKDAHRYTFLKEKLSDYKDLIAWSLKTKLITEESAENLLEIAGQKPDEAEKVLKRAIGLRHSIYHLFISAIENRISESADLKRLNDELAVSRRHQQLSGGGSGFSFEWTNHEEALDSVLWQISESAATVLITGDLTRVKQCGGHDCRWMFLDTSRNRSRQWCDMKDCGNLAKVRRFRRKSG